MKVDPTKEECEYIRDSLKKFNDLIVGDDGHTALNLIEYDTNGNIIGGLLGGTYWGWLYIDILWVAETHRRQGIGSRLLAVAEKEAISRGCHHAHVDTMSWQAPKFYIKHGYQEIGTLPDIPLDNQKILFMKQLQNKSKLKGESL